MAKMVNLRNRPSQILINKKRHGSISRGILTTWKRQNLSGNHLLMAMPALGKRNTRKNKRRLKKKKNSKKRRSRSEKLHYKQR